MYHGVQEAMRGCLVQQTRLETVANNLANATTTGFKKDSLYFDEMLRAKTKTNLTQGNMRQTGNPLDLAISGDGFFKVETPYGIRYTRNGKFLVNAEGVLVTSEGDPVMGDDEDWIDTDDEWLDDFQGEEDFA